MKGVSMSQYKDPAIKLFGTQIPVPKTQIPAISQLKETNSECLMEEDKQTSSKHDEDQVDKNSTDEEQVLKKPDKIIPCPRCNSLDTKFCYFNNYNVNQPRHFCKNCQRYWTAGGTMRNVPIGAGRRKNKHLGCQYRQILVSSDGLPIARIDAENPSNHTTLDHATGNNGMVLKFGPDNTSVGESMEPVLSLGDQHKVVETEEPSLHGSSTTNGFSENVARSSPMQCFPAPPIVFSWNPGFNNTGQMAFCPSNIPLQFIPASYWGCAPMWPTSCSGNGSPTLGKHARDANTFYEAEKCVLVPKTLRMDDPNEASRIPIWATTLGIKPDPKENKADTRNATEAAHIMEANPAALSRSHAFQESA